jgi:hypothetical protein
VKQRLTGDKYIVSLSPSIAGFHQYDAQSAYSTASIAEQKLKQYSFSIHTRSNRNDSHALQNFQSRLMRI